MLPVSGWVLDFRGSVTGTQEFDMSHSMGRFGMHIGRFDATQIVDLIFEM